MNHALLCRRGLCAVASLVCCLVATWAIAAEPNPVDFVRDVQPILQARCSACHGPDEQQGQLRLDAKASAFQGGVSGRVLEPGRAKDSLLYQRLVGTGEGDRMPLDEEPLSEEQIELIRHWIDEGAAWPDGVGATVTVERHWAYVSPTRPPLPQINRLAWIRTPVDVWVWTRLEAEGLTPAPRADEATLLRRLYLDLVGLPPSVEEVDAFLVETAPDKYERIVDRLLASPQYGERWARPWLDAARYADTNGYQADQYRTVWPYRDWVINAMNEDLPFDRFTIEQLAGDLLPKATLPQKVATGFHRLTTCNVEAGVDPEENRINQIIDRVNTTGTVWLGTSLECAQCHNHKYDPFSQRDYYRLFAYFNNTPLEVEGDGVTYEFTGPKMDLPLTPAQQEQRDQLTQERAQLQEQLDELVAERLSALAEWEQQVAQSGSADLPANIRRILAIKKRNARQQQALEAYFTGLAPGIKQLQEQLAALQTQIDTVAPTTTLVMVEQEQPRTTMIFRRGNFLDHGPTVSMGTPSALPDSPAEPAGDRRDLAAWLTSRENPLTARVAANRWWAEFFGSGIVETLEDFGTQGERPTHPELLDWLACEFMDSGWSMKHVHRQIVLSAAYQQSSRVSPELLQRDPYNTLYARGPRVRLSAESVRDNALAISGLLSVQMAGPPVYPPQPDGFWRHVGRNEPKYNTSQGSDRFRRGIYVFWRRSAPYPSFTNFDAPDRASCVVKRPRTNTPLQALTLLNDPAYVEQALALAERVATAEACATVEERAAYALRLCVARAPRLDEVRHLAEVYRQERQRFEETPPAAQALTSRYVDSRVDRRDLAAWFYVANILLNLDETITKS